MSTETRAPRRRRWRLAWKIAGALALILVVAGFALPTLLSTGSARKAILARADAMLRPAKLEVDTFRFSWFSPTKMTGFRLIDREGQSCLTSDEADWDRTLWQILFDRPRFGTITYPGGLVRLVRNDQGELNLVEAIRPILRRDPRLDIRFRIPHGALVLQTPELPRLFQAGDADIDLHVPVNLGPLELHAELSPQKGVTAQALIVDARVPRAEGDTRLSADVECRSFPFPIDVAMIQGGCNATGEIHLAGESGAITLRGDLALADVDLTAPVLRGDHVRLDRLQVAIDLGQDGAAWTIREAKADSSMLQISARGSYPPTSKAGLSLDGKVDLPPLLSQLSHAIPLRAGMKWSAGSAILKADALEGEGGELVHVHAELAGLEGTDGERSVKLREPAELEAGLVRKSGVLGIEHVSVRTAFLNIEGTGAPSGGLDFHGTVELAGLQRQAADLIDFGKLDLAGDGKLSGHYERQGDDYAFSMAMDLTDLKVAGLPPIRLEEPSLAFRCDAGGPASEQGLPKGLARAKLSIEARNLNAEIALGEKLQGTLRLPLEIAGGSGLLQADLVANRKFLGMSLPIRFERLGLALTPTGGQPLTLNASGMFDGAGGTLELEQVEGEASTIRLMPGGLRLTGFHGGALRTEGGFTGDIPPIARFVADWTGQEAPNLLGTWVARFLAREEDGVYRASARLDLPDLTRPSIDNEADAKALLLPIAAKVQAEYDKGRDRLTLRPFEASGDIASLVVRGTIDEPMRRRIVDLNGVVALNQELFQAFLVTRVEPEANISLRPREFRIRGALTGDSPVAILRGLDAEIGVDVEQLDIYGLRFGPMPLVARVSSGRASIEPIQARLNGGSIDIRPIIEMDDERGIWMGFQPGSGIQGVQINEEVSRRYLFYAAPMLYNATSVRGIVSGRIDQASIPLFGADEDDQAAAQGVLDFQQVTFYPGPVFREVVETIRMPGLATIPLLRLDQAVNWQVRDGRVYQPGVPFTLVNVMNGDMSGSVGFDKSLDLLLRMPVVPGFVSQIPIVGELTGRNKLEIPVQGTLAEPKVGKARFGPETARPGEPPLVRPNDGAPNRPPGGGLLDMINQLIPKPAAIPAPPAPGQVAPPGPGQITIPAPPGPAMPPEEKRLERQRKQQEKRQQRIEKQQAKKKGDG
ncbi:MAG: hypothetical protein U0800_17350 [Isosphaeraceae bacterium]